MKIKICVTVRNRLHSTIKCIRSLVNTSADVADIFVYDNRSDIDMAKLSQFYVNLMSEGQIAGVTFNTKRSQENVYWDKSFVFSQFLNMVSSPAHPDTEYVMLVDNDVQFHPNWWKACISAINDKSCHDRNIKVISPWNGPPKYADLEEFLTNELLYMYRRDSVGTPCWFSTLDYWKSLGTPPYGLKDAKPDDAWWWGVMRERKEFIGVLTNNLVTDITPFNGGSNYSARLTYVGQDYPPSETN